MTVKQLNKRLGEALGWSPYDNEPIFAWVFSEELLWPATPTGRMIQRRVEVPLILTPDTESVPLYAPEYVAKKQCAKLDHQWLIAKWCAPDALPMWQQNFPGAHYPARGYRIHTNADLAPHCVPTLEDTEAFIAIINEQRSMSFNERLLDMETDLDKKDKSVKNEIYDEVRDLVPAFANYQPGKKGGYVSLPYTEREKK